MRIVLWFILKSLVLHSLADFSKAYLRSLSLNAFLDQLGAFSVFPALIMKISTSVSFKVVSTWLGGLIGRVNLFEIWNLKKGSVLMIPFYIYKTGKKIEKFKFGV